MNASTPFPSGSKPFSAVYLCGVIAESFPEANYKDRALAPGPVAANAPDEGEGVVPITQIPEPMPSGSATYDTVCSRFPVKEMWVAVQSVSSIF